MNRLVIDAGNSAVKMAVYNGSEKKHFSIEANLTLEKLQQVIQEFKPVSSILSSVINLNDGVIAAFQQLPCHVVLNHLTSLPFTNLYVSPESLGRDRLANAAGAFSLFPSQNVLVMDVGTCLKFDFINEKAEYLGGSISPGLYMRYKALHHFTELLPLLEPVEKPPLTGNTTHFSIHSGIWNGMLAEINGIISNYEKDVLNVQLILTGGDGRFFLNHLKKAIFASPELTLKGLLSILQHNYPNDL